MSGRDSLLKLSDKTIVLVGAFGATQQAIVSALCEQGADVALVGPQRPEPQRYADHIMGQREVFQHFGRAGVIGVPNWEAAAMKDALGRVAHSFGRIDCVVDMVGDESLPRMSDLLQLAVPFLVARPKSRFLVVGYRPGLAKLRIESSVNSSGQETRVWTEQRSQEHRDQNLMINRLELGLTEEFLIENRKEAKSIRSALDEIKKDLPAAKLVDPQEVSGWIMFLASPLSQAMTGHSLAVDHGCFREIVPAL